MVVSRGRVIVFEGVMIPVTGKTDEIPIFRRSCCDESPQPNAVRISNDEMSNCCSGRRIDEIPPE